MRRIHPPSGFTLVEVMLALTLMAVILLGFTTAVRSSSQTYSSVAVVSGLENDAHDMLDRIADELRLAGTGSPDWAFDPAVPGVVTYNRCLGSFQGTVAWDVPMTLAAIADYGEIGGDGVDNNGNGLVDEQRLVIEDPLTLAIVQEWCHHVRSGGLVFAKNGNDITVSLTLEKLNPEGALTSYSAATVVSLRN